MDVAIPNHLFLSLTRNNWYELYSLTFRPLNPKSLESGKCKMLCPVQKFGGILCMNKQVIKRQKQHLVFYIIIFYTVAIFPLNNLLCLSANPEMRSGLIVFWLVSALLVVQKVYPRVTTNEGFKTLHKSVKHLLYTLDSPAQGIVFPSNYIELCVTKPVRNIKTECSQNNHL